MEKTFDLREFILMIYEKFKQCISLALILGVLGFIYASITNENDIYISQSSSSINLIKAEVNDSDGLDIVMGNIRETVSSNYFYIGILNDLNQNFEDTEIEDLFKNNSNPNLQDLQKVLNIYTSGNNVIVEVKAINSVTAQKFSNKIRETTAKKLAQNIQNITITIQDQYVYNQLLETGNINGQRTIKYTLAGFAGGILVGILYAFFFNVMDTKVKTINDLQKYNLPILGEITEGEDSDD